MKKNNKKVRNRKISIFKIIALLLFIMSIFVIVVLNKIDVLPTKYYLIAVGIIFFINLIYDIFLIRKSAKKILRIFFSFLSIITIILMGLISYYIIDTLGFLSTIKDVGYKTENYSVIVMKDSKYEKIEDIKDEKIGYYSNSTGASKVNKELSKKVDVNLEEYKDLNEMTNKFLEQTLDVIVIENSVLSMLKEDNTSFETDIKVIYTFSIKAKDKTNAKEVNVVSEPFNIYLSGIDTYGEISSVSRSDVNMVITVNPKTKQILLTSIPRDYYVKLSGIKGNKDKLTHAGMYGVDMSIATIEDLLDIEINYYLKVNFTSLIDIVDALGGITVYSDYTFTSIDGMKYTKGNNAMNGEEALSFARERKAFNAGDRQRVKNQQAVISALINKICSKSILVKYNSLLDSLSGEFQTNMSTKKITSLIKMQLGDMASWNVSSYSLEGTDSRDYTYSGGNIKLYVMEPVVGSVEEANKLINSVLKGNKLEKNYAYNGPINTVSKVSNSNTSKKEDDDVKDETEIEIEEIEKKEEIEETEEFEKTIDDNKNSEVEKIETEKKTFESVKPTITKKDPYDATPSCKINANGKCDIVDEEGIEQEIDVKYTCNEGDTLIGTQCQSQEEKISCPSDYKYDDNNKVCCPLGTTFNGKLCIQN